MINKEENLPQRAQRRLRRKKTYYGVAASMLCVSPVVKKTLLLLLLIPVLAQARPGYHEPWGKHADLKVPSREEPPPPKLSLMAQFAEKMILFHQNVLTQADGPRSHFRPTSSRYMLLAIRRHGFLQGFMMGCDRLLRENEDAWCYRTIDIDGQVYKFDPIPK